jgi:hypothetical protein
LDSKRIYPLLDLTCGSVGAIRIANLGGDEISDNREIGANASDLLTFESRVRILLSVGKKQRKFRGLGGGDGGIRTHDTLSGMTI